MFCSQTSVDFLKTCKEDELSTRIQRFLGNCDNVTDLLKETLGSPVEPLSEADSALRRESPMQCVGGDGGPNWRLEEATASTSSQLQNMHGLQGTHTAGHLLASSSSAQKHKRDDMGGEQSRKHGSEECKSRMLLVSKDPHHAQAYELDRHSKKRCHSKSSCKPPKLRNELDHTQGREPNHCSTKHCLSKAPGNLHNSLKASVHAQSHRPEHRSKKRHCPMSPHEPRIVSKDPGNAQECMQEHHGKKRFGSRSPRECVATRDSQSLLPSLIDKLSSMMQKPTAYVRPMDGQETQECKTSSECRTEADLKANIKTCLFELKTPVQLLEISMPGDSNCVDLKNIAQLWSPSSTVLTSSKTEPSKFLTPFKNTEQRESHPNGGKEKYSPVMMSPVTSHKLKACDVNRATLLQEDLKLSSSDDSDDEQGFAKNPSKNTAGSSLIKSAEQARDDSSSLDSSSDSSSGSDSECESESGSTDSKANEAPFVTPHQPEPPTANMWQLDNWLQKVNKLSPVSSVDSNVPTKSKKEGKEQMSDSEHGAQEGTRDPCTAVQSKDQRDATVVADVTHTEQKLLVQSDGKATQCRTMDQTQPKKSKNPSEVQESRGVKAEHKSTPKTPPQLPKGATKGPQILSIKKEPKSPLRQAFNKGRSKTSNKTMQKSEALTDSTMPSLDAEENDRIPSTLLTPSNYQESVKENNISPVSTLSPLHEKQPVSPLRNSNTKVPNKEELMVKINLNLLSWVPGQSCKEHGPPKLEKGDITQQNRKGFQKQSGNKVTSQMKKKPKDKVFKSSDNWRAPQPPYSERSQSQRPKLIFCDRLYSADEYLQEAKKLKHKADTLTDRFEKAVYYLDAVTSFIECGHALEKKVEEAKSPFPMYAETVELIKYTMKLRSYVAPDATPVDKRLALLCLRCQAFLYLRLFKLRKESALRYSKALTEHSKSFINHTPAPSLGMASQTVSIPSPHSPATSADHSSSGSSTIANSYVTIPQSIHQMTTSYVHLTSSILHAVDVWDQSEQLAKEEKDFFSQLDKVMAPLMFNSSSITDLVRYTRQGLHWVRLDTNLLP